MLTTIIQELANLLIGVNPTIKINELPNTLFNGDTNTLTFSKIILNDGKEFDLEKKASILAFNLEKYSLDFIQTTKKKSVLKSIDKLERTYDGKKYVLFMHGPFFNIHNGITIGRKKIGEHSFDVLFEDYYSPWTETDVPQHIQGFGYTDKDDNLFFENTSELTDKIYNESKTLFEGVPLIIDKSKFINNLAPDAYYKVLNSNALHTYVMGVPRYGMAFTFLGIATHDTKKYLVIIITDDIQELGYLKFNYTFDMLYQITNELKIDKMIYTDGSDSIFIKSKSKFLYNHLTAKKNRLMPFYFGIKKK